MMYRRQATPDPIAVMDLGGEVAPIATLRDEHGGVAHIISDDHCYVLILQREDGRCFNSDHWFPQAVQALKGLPDLWLNWATANKVPCEEREPQPADG